MAIVPESILSPATLGPPAVACDPSVLVGAAHHVGPPDVSPAVDCFSFPVEFERFDSDVTVDANGYPVTASGAGCFIALAHVFPTPGSRIQHLPQGHTVGGSIEIHTTTRLFADDPNVSRVPGDRLRWRGKHWLVNVEGSRATGPDGAFVWGIYFAEEIDG